MSTDPTSDQSAGDLQSRIDQLEEAAGFSERNTSRLEALVAELSAQVYELGIKLTRFERRLSDLQTNQREVPNEPPPHSHRPN